MTKEDPKRCCLYARNYQDCEERYYTPNQPHTVLARLFPEPAVECIEKHLAFEEQRSQKLQFPEGGPSILAPLCTITVVYHAIGWFWLSWFYAVASVSCVVFFWRIGECEWRWDESVFSFLARALFAYLVGPTVVIWCAFEWLIGEKV